VQSIFGPTVATVQGGTRETPSRAVPVGSSRIQLTLSRENWPATGIDLGFLLSFDGGQNYVLKPGLTHIAQATADPKRPGVITPAILSVGWNLDNPQDVPTDAKIQTVNPSGNFQSTVTLEVT
jgi:hypothetical protein